MIEVEKKFILSGDGKNKLIKGAELTAKKKFTDVYYDTADYALTKKDIWLRARDGRYELKVPLRSQKTSSWDHYEEIENEDGIKKELKIATSEPLELALPSTGYKPFATIVTTRAKYKKGEFTIDIDAVDYGYDIAEIELMVNKKEEVEEATKKIAAFAASCGLKIGRVRGKVIEYIRRKNEEHFKALELAWGVKL